MIAQLAARQLCIHHVSNEPPHVSTEPPHLHWATSSQPRLHWAARSSLGHHISTELLNLNPISIIHWATSSQPRLNWAARSSLGHHISTELLNLNPISTEPLHLNHVSTEPPDLHWDHSISKEPTHLQYVSNNTLSQSTTTSSNKLYHLDQHSNAISIMSHHISKETSTMKKLPHLKWTTTSLKKSHIANGSSHLQG